MEHIERKLDEMEQAQKRLRREQDGGEVKPVQLETLIDTGHCLITRRDCNGTLPRCRRRYLSAAPWSPRSGSRVIHRQKTSAMFDSRRRQTPADSEVLLPDGPKIAF